jgi:hypothetical protein
MSDRAMTEALAERIEAEAAALGMYERDDIAHASGLSRERVDLVLDGTRWPCPNDLHCLARALGKRPDQLIPNRDEI